MLTCRRPCPDEVQHQRRVDAFIQMLVGICKRVLAWAQAAYNLLDRLGNIHLTVITMDMFRDTFVDLAGSLLDRLFEKGCADKQHALRTANAEHPLREPNIFRRDVCTDAFGTGWSSNTCTPGNTLCCKLFCPKVLGTCLTDMQVSRIMHRCRHVLSTWALAGVVQQSEIHYDDIPSEPS